MYVLQGRVYFTDRAMIYRPDWNFMIQYIYWLNVIFSINYYRPWFMDQYEIYGPIDFITTVNMITRCDIKFNSFLG